MSTEASEAAERVGVGRQLDGRALYENQKRLRSRPDYLAAPTIVATSLQTTENMGSVLRLADAAGAARVIFLSDEEGPDLAKVKRTARSADTFVEWDVQTYAEFLTGGAVQLQPLIAIELTNVSTSLFDCVLPESCAIVVGNERHGIPASVLQHCAPFIFPCSA